MAEFSFHAQGKAHSSYICSHPDARFVLVVFYICLAALSELEVIANVVTMLTHPSKTVSEDIQVNRQ